MSRPFKKAKLSKFNQVLSNEGLNGATLIERAKELGLTMQPNVAYDVMNQSRDFHVSSGYKLIDVLNEITGKSYKWDDVFAPFKFL